MVDQARRQCREIALLSFLDPLPRLGEQSPRLAATVGALDGPCKTARAPFDPPQVALALRGLAPVGQRDRCLDAHLAAQRGAIICGGWLRRVDEPLHLEPPWGHDEASLPDVTEGLGLDANLADPLHRQDIVFVDTLQVRRGHVERADVAMPTFEPGDAGLFAPLDAGKERLKRLVQPIQGRAWALYLLLRKLGVALAQVRQCFVLVILSYGHALTFVRNETRLKPCIPQQAWLAEERPQLTRRGATACRPVRNGLPRGDDRMKIN